ncbi:MAG: TDP-N-acetylfucosamine:lipid II N-acetylfucosaminyltransferase [Draconibacterium sp.]
MLLHIAEDEKFIDSIIPEFEEIAPNKNIFLIVKPYDEYRLKYTNSNKIVCVTYNSAEYYEIIKENKNADAIIFHNAIKRYKWDLLKKLPSSTPKVWIAWGADLYSCSRLANAIYKSKTKKHAREVHKALTTLKGPLKNILYELGSRVPKSWLLKLKLIDNIENYFKYIDYLSPVIKEDFDLLKRNYPNSTFKYLPFNYNLNAGLYSNMDQPINSGKNILVGNSASPVNNHLDTFQLLRSIQLDPDQKIIVPLSYGGDQKYIKTIIKQGRKYFGDHFLPITEFMPKEEYYKLLYSVGFGFFNSLRQHAMGNINLLIFLGAKVFLDKKNPAHSFYHKLKVNFRTINSDVSYLTIELSTNLKKEQILLNRSIIHEAFGISSFQTKLDHFISKLLGK